AISVNGYGKRTPLLTVGDDGEPVSERSFKVQNRGGLGVVAMATSERNGELVRLRLVDPSDGLMVITDGGQIIRTRVSEIREAGRNTQGVIVIRLNEGERVVDIEPVSAEEAEDEAVEGAVGADAVAESAAEATAAEATQGDAAPTPEPSDGEE
nr:hypothetical protein [Myxococcota bacterium]